ncbi:hypothetical protein CTI12_AA259660 [Artemisia annua]|uniref:Uncharacterized protein n=1 Tax=Artemisia annua TaxID=35608 RepID=A0A2U1NJL0_ARTAN|nr:hypothetical protein CTI12_AA259660 [Artemisia annua]
MDNYHLNKAGLIVVAVVDAKNRVVNSQIQVMDEVVDDPDVHHVFDEMRSALLRSLEEGSVEWKNGREIALQAGAKPRKKCGCCGEKTNEHTPSQHVR